MVHATSIYLKHQTIKIFMLINLVDMEVFHCINGNFDLLVALDDESEFYQSHKDHPVGTMDIVAVEIFQSKRVMSSV